MKYKNIKSMAHNFAHSFLSWDNYVDGEYVVEEFKQFIRENRDKRLQFNWAPSGDVCNEILSIKAQKSFGYYLNWLPKHLENHNVDITMIQEFRVEMYMELNHQIHAEYYVIDDRNKEHKGSVSF